MTAQLPIAVMGCSGRMGQMLVKGILDSENLHLSGVTDRPDSDWIGRDLGEMLGGQALGVIVQNSLEDVLANSQAIIDFTSPDATVLHAELAAKAGIVHVIGTTGFTPAHLKAIAQAAEKAVIIRAGNMSLGVNLLTELTRRVATSLGEEFDIEVVETHHRHKVDAPSGTALMLGQAAADGRGIDLDRHSDRGRDGITGARKKGQIGFSALRGGDVVGEHDVMFLADGERIILRHIATDRQVFTRGALKAALWGQGKPAGEYSMLDVLELS